MKKLLILILTLGCQMVLAMEKPEYQFVGYVDYIGSSNEQADLQKADSILMESTIVISKLTVAEEKLGKELRLHRGQLTNYAQKVMQKFERRLVIGKNLHSNLQSLLGSFEDLNSPEVKVIVQNFTNLANEFARLEKRLASLKSDFKPINISSSKTKLTEQSDGKEMECKICLSDVNQANTKKLECGHAFCNFCLIKLIELSIKEKNVLDQLLCPIRDCRKKFTPKDLENIVPDKQTRKVVLEIADNQEKAKNKNFRHCPTPECAYSYLCNEKEPREITCPNCLQNYCNVCLEKHSSSVACSESKLEAWAKNHDTGQCPYCNELYEKNEGCDHMTCKKCNSQFCWLCKKPWNYGMLHGRGLCYNPPPVWPKGI